MEEMIPCSVKDQEVFQRVWQRVMAGRNDAQCPLEAMPPNLQGDLSCECLEALTRQENPGLPPECRPHPGEEAPLPDCPAQGQPIPEPPAAEAPMPDCPTQEPPAPEPPADETPAPDCPTREPPAPEPPVEDIPGASTPECPQPPASPDVLPEQDGSHRDSDLPRLWEEPQEAADRTARLRRQVMDALEGWQFYRHLARRARAADARVLNSMAGEMHRHARKLSAAYFLLTGLRYWPSEMLSTPSIPSYWGALRTRHQTEQRQETAYRMASDDWNDPDMQELYAGLIEACQHRSRQLRSLLEQDAS